MSALITSFISVVYVFLSETMDVLFPYPGMTFWTVFAKAGGIFEITFLFIEPVILLIVFAVIQRKHFG